MFEATLVFGQRRTGNSELLKTLPHGEAKLATLHVKEFVARNKANAEAAAKATAVGAVNQKSEDKTPAASAAKKQKTLGDMLGKGKDAPTHGDGIDVDAGSTKLQKDPMATPTTPPADLFPKDSDDDCALIDWLRAHEKHPRCEALLQEIIEWTGKAQKAEMR